MKHVLTITLALLLLFGASAFGQDHTRIITLTDGSEFLGTLLRDTRNNEGTTGEIIIEVDGERRTYEAMEVLSCLSPNQAFWAHWDECDTAYDHLRLAKWCEDRGLKAFMYTELNEVLRMTGQSGGEILDRVIEAIPMLEVRGRGIAWNDEARVEGITIGVETTIRHTDTGGETRGVTDWGPLGNTQVLLNYFGITNYNSGDFRRNSELEQPTYWLRIEIETETGTISQFYGNTVVVYCDGECTIRIEKNDGNDNYELVDTIEGEVDDYSNNPESNAIQGARRQSHTDALAKLFVHEELAQYIHNEPILGWVPEFLASQNQDPLIVIGEIQTVVSLTDDQRDRLNQAASLLLHKSRELERLEARKLAADLADRNIRNDRDFTREAGSVREGLEEAQLMLQDLKAELEDQYGSRLGDDRFNFHLNKLLEQADEFIAGARLLVQ